MGGGMGGMAGGGQAAFVISTIPVSDGQSGDADLLGGLKNANDANQQWKVRRLKQRQDAGQNSGAMGGMGGGGIGAGFSDAITVRVGARLRHGDPPSGRQHSKIRTLWALPSRAGCGCDGSAARSVTESVPSGPQYGRKIAGTSTDLDPQGVLFGRDEAVVGRGAI